MPTVRSQLLEVVRDAYPETFEGLTPSKPLGESVFDGPTPHPNEVLNLFLQQKLTSALPMAYYMAARRGLDSLMDRRLPRNATLSPDVLQSAIRGLMALREAELSGTHRLVFGTDDPSATPTSPAVLEAFQKIIDHIVGPSQQGTRALQVPEFYQDRGGKTVFIFPKIFRSRVEGWESGHADLRKKVWSMLPDAFGLAG